MLALHFRRSYTLLVKQEISIAYSGTVPTAGYAVSRALLLESTS